MTPRHGRAMEQNCRRHGALGVCAMMARHEGETPSWRAPSWRHDALWPMARKGQKH